MKHAGKDMLLNAPDPKNYKESEKTDKLRKVINEIDPFNNTFTK